MPEKKQLVAPDIKLSKRQKAFADHYLICQNGQEAAQKAGYTGNNLATRGARLKALPSVQAYLEYRAQQLVRDHEPMLIAMANSLKDKDQTIIQALKAFNDCKTGSAVGFRYFELLAKLNNHLTDQRSPNIFVDSNGKDLTINEVIADANEAQLILRQIKLSASNNTVNHENSTPSQENPADIINIQSSTNDRANEYEVIEDEPA